MYLTVFILIAMIYTSLEVAYWYLKWYKHINKEPMPVVKALLSAVFLAHVIKIGAISYRIYTHHILWSEPVFYLFPLLGSLAYMTAIFRQDIHRCTKPLSFFARVATISSILTWSVYAIIQ